MQQFFRHLFFRESIIGLVGVTIFGCGVKEIRVNVPPATLVEDVQCIAVPPFNDYTNSDNKAGHIVAEIATEEFLNQKSVGVFPRSEIMAALRGQNINLHGDITAPEAVWLGKLVGVDAVLLGTVASYAYESADGLLIGNPTVDIHVKLISIKAREVIWSSQIVRVGHDLFNGKRLPLSLLAMEAISELLAQLPLKKWVSDKGLPQFCGNRRFSVDVDNDNVLNLADLCPIRAENINGINDFDGCPELVGVGAGYLEYLTVDGDRLVLKQPVRFQPNKTAILSESYQVLRELAKFLVNNPQVKKVMIEGFIPQEQNSKLEERFAFARASAVKEFLIREEVEEKRLIAVGYGLVSKGESKAVEFTIVE